jgi:alkaline phosphatase
MKKFSKPFSFFILTSLLLTGAIGQTSQPSFPVKRDESAEAWKRDGWNAIERAKKEKIRKGKAKNVILFIGDGMGVSTLTAARILEGQLRGESGEENRLSFEDFPYSALSKTYGTNQQTSDSAPTASAFMTGVKTDEGVLSVNKNIVHGDYTTVKGNETKTLLETAEESGRSTGIVSTARLTHATPGATYAHTCDRDWESDTDIFNRSKDAYNAKFPDIASQMLSMKYGDGLEVALGGGRAKFLPKTTTDPEYANRSGDRMDGRDMTKEWTAKNKDSAYVWNKQQFDAIDVKKTKHLLGLFEPSYMQFEHDRAKDAAGEPSLKDMTTKAIDMLSQNKKGYFLMVEGGRVDHGHHNGNAFRALTDAIALSDAVRAAVQKVDLDETLIIVTADHSHTLTMMGYPMRGNNILGLVREIGNDGNPEADVKRDRNGEPMTTLNYTSGKGYKEGTIVTKNGKQVRERVDQSKVDTTDPDYLQEAMIPLGDETHGGEDVAIFATGAGAYLIRGSMEESWIYYVMAEAMRLK